MQRRMHHKSPSHIHHCLNSPFSLSILMLGTNPRERLRLTLLSTLLLVLIRRKNAIIPMDVLQCSIGCIIQPLLKTLFAHKSLTSSQGHLVLNPNEARSCIVVNCTTIVTVIWPFPTITCRKTTRSATDKLIRRHKIPNFKLISTDGSLRVLIYLRPFNIGRPSTTSCQQT